jgi:putative FmdB family regulatory protein
MPTYDYRCKACGHAWELFQSMSAKPEKACPSCGKKTAERLIGTGAAVMFKGSGFYQTDYRSESYKKAAAADKPSEAKSSDSKPSESKPAASDSAPATPSAAPTKPAPASASPGASGSPAKGSTKPGAAAKRNAK